MGKRLTQKERHFTQAARTWIDIIRLICGSALCQVTVHTRQFWIEVPSVFDGGNKEIRDGRDLSDMMDSNENPIENGPAYRTQESAVIGCLEV